MLRRYGRWHQVWSKVGLPLCLVLCTLTLTGITTPGGMAYKPIRKDPPWPSICRMTPDSLSCIPID